MTTLMPRALPLSARMERTATLRPIRVPARITEASPNGCEIGCKLNRPLAMQDLVAQVQCAGSCRGARSSVRPLLCKAQVS
jgi:hypothetical protein